MLLANPGERIMHPEFGCCFRHILFALDNRVTAGLLVLTLRHTLSRGLLEQTTVIPVAERAKSLALSSHKVAGTESATTLLARS